MISSELRSQILNASTEAGIYKFLDHKSLVLYVGKSISLKQRLSSYLNLNSLCNRMRIMIHKARFVEIVKVNNESEAFLLECSLIKALRPIYNIRLLDDKSYPFIFITHHKYPRIMKKRVRDRNVQGRYFGPYVSVIDVENIIIEIQKSCGMRICSDVSFLRRSRPCMEYQIGRCTAPCVQRIDELEYAERVNEGEKILSGKNTEVVTNLSNKMQAASANMNYELAAKFRDRIKSVESIQQRNALQQKALENGDVIAIHKIDEICVIYQLIIINYACINNCAYWPQISKDDTCEEIAKRFLLERYDAINKPQEIVINHLPNESVMVIELMRENCKGQMKITYPQRGDKKHLLEIANTNARQLLESKCNETGMHRKKFEDIAELFNLTYRPERIEIYDNSHINGTNPIGVMVVATNFGFNTAEYKKFNIRDTNSGDDYTMMREVLQRRFELKITMPDFIFIDGGAGHCSVVKDIISEFDIPFVCIAKGEDRNAGEERFFTHDMKELQLPKDDSTLHYIQVLRDEAHRFAITSHRKAREKNMHKSVLDVIPGIGKVRKQKLLRHFKSISKIKSATPEEISQILSVGVGFAKTLLKCMNV